MADYLAPLLIIALMVALSFFFLHILTKRPTIRTVVLLPVGEGMATELMLRESLTALSHLSCSVEVTVALLDTGTDEDAARRIRLMEHDYPTLSFVYSDQLETLRCMDLFTAEASLFGR